MDFNKNTPQLTLKSVLSASGWAAFHIAPAISQVLQTIALNIL